MSIPSQEQVTLLTDFDTTSAYSVAYQTLYTNISLNWDHERVKQQVIVLTTPTAYPGQAAVAANIAIVAAQNGTPTIIVDADLHAPTLQKRFGISQGAADVAGLSDLLAQKEHQPIADILYDTFIPHLRLLCAGTTPVSSTSMLLSTRLQLVVADLRRLLTATEQEPGLIVFNSPAVLAGGDATLISNIADQTFLALVSGRTTRRQARQAKEQLQHAHSTLAGIIMLDV